MRQYLLDTNVVSTSSPLKTDASDGRVPEWLRARSDRLYLSVVCLAEIRAGVAKTRRAGQERKADILDRWLGQLTFFYGERALLVDAAVADASGILFDRALGAGHAPGWIDVQIAATSQVHDLTLLTRNGRHFEPMGVTYLDPFAAGFDAE